MALGCGVAQADTRAVGSDGNLWSIDEEGAILKIAPDGDTVTFPIEEQAEAIAKGPTGKVTIVTRPDVFFFGPTSVRNVTSDGTIETLFSPLNSRMDLIWTSHRGVGVGAGKTWVSQGWAPCQDNQAGNLWTMNEAGVRRLYRGPLDVDIANVYPGEGLSVDGAGRAWVTGYVPDEVECDGEWPTQWSGALAYLLVEDGKVTGTPCSWDSQGAAIANDGSAWCSGGNHIYRMDLTGDATEYELPQTWAWPNYLRAGPDGTVWFATLTSITDGTYDKDWTIASISPQGELVTYPGFDDTLTQEVAPYGGFVGLYDWRFSNQETVWLLNRWRGGDNPLRGIVPVPNGVSQGLLPSRKANFPPPPGPGPKPGHPDLEFRFNIIPTGDIPRRKIRRTAMISVKVWTSQAAKVTVRAQITHRMAKRIGLRSRKSKNLKPYVLGKTTVNSAGGYQNLVIRLSTKKAKLLASKPGKIRIVAMAAGQTGNYFFVRNLRTR